MRSHIKRRNQENKSEHPTGTLATSFQKPLGEANPYVRFGYGPLKNFNHTQRQVVVSINPDPINTKKTGQQSTTQR